MAVVAAALLLPGPLPAQAPATGDSAGIGDAAVAAPALSGEVGPAPNGDGVAIRLRPAPSGAPVTAFRVELGWDPSKLELAAVRPEGSGADAGSGPGAAGPSRVVVAAERSGERADSTGALVRATFGPGPELAGGERVDVTVDVRELRGPGGEDLLDSLRAGVTSVCLRALPVGDVDGDGRRTTRDAVAMLRVHVGMPPGEGADLSRGDLNADGAADTADARRLLRRSIGLPDGPGGTSPGPSPGNVAAADSAAVGDSVASADSVAAGPGRTGTPPALGGCS